MLLIYHNDKSDHDNFGSIICIFDMKNDDICNSNDIQTVYQNFVYFCSAASPSNSKTLFLEYLAYNH